jgi:hypothetical protein|tara:strand:+ start:3041 stop:3154 length:114 start_codon:yes stop_codon:yes gene_type:complete
MGKISYKTQQKNKTLEEFIKEKNHLTDEEVKEIKKKK